MKRIIMAEVNGRRSPGRQKKRWGDMIQQDMKLLRLKKEDTGDRKKWRRSNHVADPSLGGINSNLNSIIACKSSTKAVDG